MSEVLTGVLILLSVSALPVLLRGWLVLGRVKALLDQEIQYREDVNAPVETEDEPDYSHFPSNPFGLGDRYEELDHYKGGP